MLVAWDVGSRGKVTMGTGAAGGGGTTLVVMGEGYASGPISESVPGQAPSSGLQEMIAGSRMGTET